MKSKVGLPMLLTAEGFLLLTVLLWLICGYLYEKVRFDKLERLKYEPENKSLLGEVLPGFHLKPARCIFILAKTGKLAYNEYNGKRGGSVYGTNDVPCLDG